ncbi:UDP-galactopyranose mutase-like [Carpediemonas membranifera]|uniref:UDP-galactopyranose mutase-like n=1 Tax=Carpediemonas membranifera TaxID=201153 RepID=A0A8J6BW55_9EUKA|nr:UDP-galactopyranose mutase-like [Carpediemonas membranifera]|eukprot:KAG9392091.1 UDP-galactopyranose mutase-like [Carpediemonas membranifera]
MLSTLALKARVMLANRAFTTRILTLSSLLAVTLLVLVLIAVSTNTSLFRQKEELIVYPEPPIDTSLPHIVIIGAGLTGLGAAHRLRELGFERYQVHEAGQQIAGAEADGLGFVWDFGALELSSHYAYFDGLLESVLEHDQDRHTRVAWLVEDDAETSVDFETAEVPPHLERFKRLTAAGPDFVYPHVGSSNELAARLAADQATVEFSSTVVAIDPINRLVSLERGGATTVQPYGKLISTLPLPNLLRLVADCPHTPRTVARRFGEHANSLTCDAGRVVGLGVEGALPDALADAHWFAVAGHDRVWRVTVLSNYASTMAPAGHYSLLVEIDAPYADENEVIEEAAAFAAQHGFIEASGKIVSRRVASERCTPADATDILTDVQPWLVEHDILSRGRLGGWKADVANSDHLFMQGVEAADASLAGVPEMTYFHPDFVNDPARGKLTGRPNQRAYSSFRGTSGQQPMLHREQGNLRRIMVSGLLDYFQGPRDPPANDIPVLVVLAGSCAAVPTIASFVGVLQTGQDFDFATVGQHVDRRMFDEPWSPHVVAYSAANRATNWLISRLILPENTAAYRFIAVLEECEAANPFDLHASYHDMDAMSIESDIQFLKIGNGHNTMFDRKFFFDAVVPELLAHQDQDFGSLGLNWS